MTYSEAYDKSRALGSSFVKFGLQPQTEAFVGIFARNRPEWVISEQAANMFSLVTVPLYDTLGTESMQFILTQTELKLIVCDDSKKALQVMGLKSNLEFLIIIDDITQEARDKASEINIRLFSFNDVILNGKESLLEPVAPKPDDLCTICYTSGTTGIPKGAMLTHKNIVSIASSMLVYVKHTNIESGHERYISYLPLAHMFERVCQCVMVSLGGSIGFFEGDIKKLVDNIKELKPTIFATVPRLLNRIYARINENISKSSGLKQKLFKLAFSRKEKEILQGIVRNDSFWDKAFKQIRDGFGGSVKIMVTGSAPISPEILHFLRVVSGCYVLEGYGATETGGACGVQLPGETTIGNVGPPFLCSKYKLIDVPEMNLVVARDNRGEVCVKGSNIFKGYFKDEEKTRAALDDDGWYHTGDIGSFNDNGTLSIVDRVKNIFKLQQGEYISPEKIENIYIRCKYLAQIYVHGNSFKSTLVAIVVPEQTTLYEFAKEKGLECDMSSLCKNKEIKDTIMKELQLLGKKGDLKGFETVRDIYLHDDLFSLENGLLTPTMKSKRNELSKYFEKQINDMYKNLD
jgi:long-chain acyl-CoA synthetase